MKKNGGGLWRLLAPSAFAIAAGLARPEVSPGCRDVGRADLVLVACGAAGGKTGRGDVSPPGARISRSTGAWIRRAATALERRLLGGVDKIVTMAQRYSIIFGLFAFLSSASFVCAAEFKIVVDAETLGEASFESALLRARAHRSEAPHDTIILDVSPGTLRRATPIILGPKDSGQPGAPLVIRGAPGGATTISGGRVIVERRWASKAGIYNNLLSRVLRLTR